MLVNTCVCMCSHEEVKSPSQGEHDALSHGTTCWSLLCESWGSIQVIGLAGRRCYPPHPLTLAFETGLSINLKFTDSARLAGQQGCLHLPKAAGPCILHECRGSEVRSSLMCALQVLHPLSRLLGNKFQSIFISTEEDLIHPS